MLNMGEAEGDDRNGSVFFYHIPKTAGTSLTAAISNYFAKQSRLPEEGHVTSSIVQSASKQHGSQRLFVYGHPKADNIHLLYKKYYCITMLRTPDDLIISNYAHIISDRKNPLYTAANELGFGNFLRTYPYYIAFQLGTILYGIKRVSPFKKIADTELMSLLPEALLQLDRFDQVGVVAHIQSFLETLAISCDLPSVPRLERLNTTQISRDQTARLQAELREIRNDPELALYFAAEDMVYAKARQRSARANQELIERRKRPMTGRFGSEQFTVACEEGNVIELARNFSPPSDGPDGQTCWWTGPSEVSRIILRAREGQDVSFGFSVYVWHMIEPQNVKLFCDGEAVELRYEIAEPRKYGRFRARLPSSRSTRKTIEIVLIRTHMPQIPPYYPAILVGDFAIQSGVSGISCVGVRLNIATPLRPGTARRRERQTGISPSPILWVASSTPFPICSRPETAASTRRHR